MFTAVACATKTLVSAGSTTFNSSGTYTVPYGVRVITVSGTGQPGNAGNAGTPGNNGAGGAGGNAGAAGNAGVIGN